MSDINYIELFENLNNIMGLPLIRKGNRWYGACFLDGTPHKRRDKVTCRINRKGKVGVIEQGSFNSDLFEYMKEYKGMTDLEAGNYLRGQCTCNYIAKEFIEPPTLYVYPHIMNSTLHKYTDNLFHFLCSLFPILDVKNAYDLYNIGSQGDITVFWQLTEDGLIAHDKRMLFSLVSGKRDKTRLPFRYFKRDDGFNALPAFGDHLRRQFQGQKIYAVESEKSALLFYLFSKKLCVGLASASCLFKAKDNDVLLPDNDKAGELWDGIEWWRYYPEYPLQDGDDIGDYIIWDKTNSK